MTGHYFKIGDFDTRERHIHVTQINVFDSARRSVDIVDVPGRNGNLIVDNGKFDNVTIAYHCMINLDEYRREEGDDSWTMTDVMWLITNWLSEFTSGYHELYDDYGKFTTADQVAWYRMARYTGGFSVANMAAGLKACSFDIEFDCKPQKFSRSGNTWVEEEVTGGTATFIIRDFQVGARPLIHLRAASTSTTVTLECTDGSGSIAVANPGTVHVFIDTETQNVYGGANMNINLNLRATVIGKFPTPTTEGREVYCSGVTQVRMKERDFTI